MHRRHFQRIQSNQVSHFMQDCKTLSCLVPILRPYPTFGLDCLQKSTWVSRWTCGWKTDVLIDGCIPTETQTPLVDRTAAEITVNSLTVNTIKKGNAQVHKDFHAKPFMPVRSWWKYILLITYILYDWCQMFACFCMWILHFRVFLNTNKEVCLSISGKVQLSAS